MSDDKKDESGGSIVKGPFPVAPQQRRANLLDIPVENLTPAQQSQLRERIVSEQIDLDKKAKEADGRFVNSSRDMARDLQYVQTLDGSTRSDYKVDASYETASGRTTVTVRRGTNLAILVIAVILGLAVIFALTR